MKLAEVRKSKDALAKGLEAREAKFFVKKARWQGRTLIRNSQTWGPCGQTPSATGQRKLFWKIRKDVRVEYISFSDWQEIPAEQAKLLIHQQPDSEEFIHKIIPEGSIGLLFADGRLVKKLAPGPCAYWKGKSTLHVVAIDMRTQNLEVSGQEILTKDRVSIRLNLDAHYRVSDAEKLVTESQDAKDLLYKELQFALRKAIGVRTLDEVLATKESLGTEVLELGTLDGMVGCVAAGMGVTLLPRAVVERNDAVSVHSLGSAQSRVETLSITRRAAYEYSALRGFISCLHKNEADIAA